MCSGRGSTHPWGAGPALGRRRPRRCEPCRPGWARHRGQRGRAPAGRAGERRSGHGCSRVQPVEPRPHAARGRYPHGRPSASVTTRTRPPWWRCFPEHHRSPGPVRSWIRSVSTRVPSSSRCSVPLLTAAVMTSGRSGAWAAGTGGTSHAVGDECSVQVAMGGLEADGVVAGHVGDRGALAHEPQQQHRRGGAAQRSTSSAGADAGAMGGQQAGDGLDEVARDVEVTAVGDLRWSITPRSCRRSLGSSSSPGPTARGLPTR